MTHASNFDALWRRGASLVGFLAVASFSAAGSAAAGDATSPAPAPTPAASATATPTSDASALEVKGFRSALFGSTETEVRAAIQKDFGVSPDAIKAVQNLVEHTMILTVRAPDVLTDGGTAEVAYTLGHKTKKLVQVTVTWSKQSDDKLTPQRLLQNGESLRNYFEGAGYVPATIMTNGAVGDGVLLFRGADEQGRTTVLLLRGSTTGDKTTGQKLVPTSLTLFYLADPKNPDIYRIPKGKF